MFVGLVWLTSNHMFGSGDFWDKSISSFLKILKLPSFSPGNFQVFKNKLVQFIQIDLPNMWLLVLTKQRYLKHSIHTNKAS